MNTQRRDIGRTVQSIAIAVVFVLGLGVLPGAGSPVQAQPHNVPDAYFNVNKENNSVFGHEWTPGSTVTVTVDDTDFEETVAVVTDWVHPWRPGDFDFGQVDFDFGPGDTVRVTSDDDPPVQKVHTVTALQVTEVSLAERTVAGTTDSEAGSIVEVGIHDEQNALRFVEVQDDGSWVADFGEPADDGGEGWGDPSDIKPGIWGYAMDRDADGDSTAVNWRAPRPRFNVVPATRIMSGWEWPAEVSLTVATSAGGSPEQTVQTSAEGSFLIDLAGLWEPIDPGDVITVTYAPDDGPATVKTLTVSSLTVTGVDVDASTVSGTADYGHATNLDEVVVVVYDEDEWIAAWRQVDVEPDGTWAADFSIPPVPDRGEGVVIFDADSHGDANQDNHTADTTSANWPPVIPDKPMPHFTIGPEHTQINGWDWPSEVDLTVATSAEGNLEQTTGTSAGGDFGLSLDGVWDPVEPGDVITVTYSPEEGEEIVKTLTVSSLTVIDVAGSTVYGVADPGDDPNMGEVVVAVYDDGEWTAWRHVDIHDDGTWSADFSVAPEPDRGEGIVIFGPGTHGDAFHPNHTGDSTFVNWRAGGGHFTVTRRYRVMNAYEWPSGVDVSVTSDRSDDVLTAQADRWGRFDLDLGWDMVPGEVITVSTIGRQHGPEIVKRLTVSSLWITTVDLDNSEVSGIADYDHPDLLNEILVVMHGPGEPWQAVRWVDIQEDGTWTAKFDTDPEPDRGYGVLAFDDATRGEAHHHNDTDDSTHIDWHIGAPLVTAVDAAPNPLPVGTAMTLTATIDDTATGRSTITGAEYSLDGGETWTPMDAADGAFDGPLEDVAATLEPFMEPTLLEVCVRGTDVEGNTSHAECVGVAVFDPDGRFVTGGGWVHSPEEADLVNGSEGRAIFGFVSRYQPGRTTPDGNLMFRFRHGDLSFESTTMDWLVVTGQPRAQFRGEGLVNGAIRCQFRADAWDGSHSAAGIDAFGLRIYDCIDGAEPYRLDPTGLGGGNIVIH